MLIERLIDTELNGKTSTSKRLNGSHEKQSFYDPYERDLRVLADSVARSGLAASWAEEKLYLDRAGESLGGRNPGTHSMFDCPKYFEGCGGAICLGIGDY